MGWRGFRYVAWAVIAATFVVGAGRASAAVTHRVASPVQAIGARGNTVAWWQDCRYGEGVKLRRATLTAWSPVSATRCIDRSGPGITSRPVLLGDRIVWWQTDGGSSYVDSAIVVKLRGHRPRTLAQASDSCGTSGYCSCQRDGDSAGTVVASFAASETQVVYSMWDIVVPSCDPELGLGEGEVSGGGVWRVSGRPLQRVAVPGVQAAGSLAIGGGRIALVPAGGSPYFHVRAAAGQIELRDAVDGTLLRTISIAAEPIAVELRANALAVLALRDGERVILVYDPSTGALMRDVPFPHKPVSAIALTTRRLVVAVGRRVITVNMDTGAQHLLGTSRVGDPVGGLVATDRHAIWFFNASIQGHYRGVIRTARLG